MEGGSVDAVVGVVAVVGCGEKAEPFLQPRAPFPRTWDPLPSIWESMVGFLNEPIGGEGSFSSQQPFWGRRLDPPPPSKGRLERPRSIAPPPPIPTPRPRPIQTPNNKSNPWI